MKSTFAIKRKKVSLYSKRTAIHSVQSPGIRAGPFLQRLLALFVVETFEIQSVCRNEPAVKVHSATWTLISN